jgi:PhnB protein
MADDSPVPEGFHTVTPYLTVDNARQALEWYKTALGAVELSRQVRPGDGLIMHGELQIGDSPIMINDTAIGGASPTTLGGSPVALWVYVEDCDALFNRAVAAGAEVRTPLTNHFWGDRSGSLMDPYGYQWTIATRLRKVPRQEMNERRKAFAKELAEREPVS